MCARNIPHKKKGLLSVFHPSLLLFALSPFCHSSITIIIIIVVTTSKVYVYARAGLSSTTIDYLLHTRNKEEGEKQEWTNAFIVTYLTAKERLEKKGHACQPVVHSLRLLQLGIMCLSWE